MIKRIASTKLLSLSRQFKSVGLIGPRQTGKTTLVRKLFQQKPYVSLENPDTRRFAQEDPRGFLGSYPLGAILDEVQRVPELFSYLQEILDQTQEKGLFILTGSNNFQLQESITQSLAGRIALMKLLPFSLRELTQNNTLIQDDDQLMLTGFYPPIYDQQIEPQDWCPNYFRTYIEKDVRQIKNITDLLVFERFIRLLAGRNGQELNYTSLAVEAGIDVKTAQSWISILESSFIVYLLRPYYRNFNKTITKRPKLYFYDTAIVCYLLGIREKKHLELHPLRGAIFEGMVITELIKQRTNAGSDNPLFYWREKSGHEIDVITEKGNNLIALEIKSGKTITSDYFRNLHYWKKLSNSDEGHILYAGDQYQKRSDGIEVLNWRTYLLSAAN